VARDHPHWQGVAQPPLGLPFFLFFSFFCFLKNKFIY
jgi:hypothetical protein